MTRIPRQPALINSGRRLVWFSCGATSACAAKLATEQYPDAEVLYCDTSSDEHPDNPRFMQDVGQWIGREIKKLHSDKYKDIYDVFNKTGWLVGPSGARCTNELKRAVRERYQQVGDIHAFGMTADEPERIADFERNNPELYLWWPLVEAGINKQDCFHMIAAAGIRLPEMYLMGYRNNNCIGCVKGGKGYWNKIRRDFPAKFDRMAKQERDMGVRILDVYLDELDPNAGRYKSEISIECGPACAISNPDGAR